MLSHDENQLITRVGPGTPMGNTMRGDWVRALLAHKIPEPEGPPVRVGLLNEYCPPRCVYQGWKFDTDGNCAEMMNEPPEDDVTHKIETTAYPTIELGGHRYLPRANLYRLFQAVKPLRQRPHAKPCRSQRRQPARPSTGAAWHGHLAPRINPRNQSKGDPADRLTGMLRPNPGPEHQPSPLLHRHISVRQGIVRRLRKLHVRLRRPDDHLLMQRQ